MIRNQGGAREAAFLKPESIKEMLSPFPHSSTAKGGLFIRSKDDEGNPTVFGHTGSSGTNCWIDLENDVIGIMITQTRGKDIGPLRKELEKQITACVTN